MNPLWDSVCLFTTISSSHFRLLSHTLNFLCAPMFFCRRSRMTGTCWTCGINLNFMYQLFFRSEQSRAYNGRFFLCVFLVTGVPLAVQICCHISLTKISPGHIELKLLNYCCILIKYVHFFPLQVCPSFFFVADTVWWPEHVELMAGLGKHSFQKNATFSRSFVFFSKDKTFSHSFAFFIIRTLRSLHSFTFFIKECGVLCVLLCSL